MEHILKEELHLTHAQTSLLYAGPFLMAAVMAIPGGLVGDRIGARKALIVGAILIAVGTFLRGVTSDASSLLAFTFIYGLGLGWSFPNFPKLVSAWVPPEKSGITAGVFISGQPLGISLALALTIPFVFPITNTFQGVFLFWSIPSVLAAILLWALAKDPPHNNVYRARTPRGRIPFRQVLSNKNLWLIGTLILLAEFFFITLLGWAPTLLMLKGASPTTTGLISSLAVWVIVPNLILMPRLAYKTGVRKLFIWVPSLVLGALAFLAIYIPLSISWLLFVVAGIANSTRYVTLIALPIEMMPREDVGTASGLVLSFGFVGGAVGPQIGGHILDITGNLDLALLVLAGISATTAGVAFRLPETGCKSRE
jgi:CP family cyanate transporter-like MFS transporter